MAIDGRSDHQGALGPGKKQGETLTTAGNSGLKRSMLTDARGVPLGVAIDGANRHDSKMVEDTNRAMLRVACGIVALRAARTFATVPVADCCL